MNTDNGNSPNEHIPVLTENLAEQIVLPTDGVMLDATVGHGGHSLLFGKQMGPDGTIVGLDVDEGCITRAHINLSSLACKVILVRANFARIKEVAAEHGIEKADLIFADLGFCSSQVAEAQKGLSFREICPWTCGWMTGLRRRQPIS